MFILKVDRFVWRMGAIFEILAFILSIHTCVYPSCVISTVALHSNRYSDR